MVRIFQNNSFNIQLLLHPGIIFPFMFKTVFLPQFDFAQFDCHVAIINLSASSGFHSIALSVMRYRNWLMFSLFHSTFVREIDAKNR